MPPSVTSRIVPSSIFEVLSTYTGFLPITFTPLATLFLILS
jgi:hypothetical protein